jgi:flagellar biosynthesis regulator FlaF
MKFEKEIAIIVKARRPETDMLNVIEALGYDQDSYQRAFDIALEMDNQSLVKLLYSNFNAGKVVVEFTLIGKAMS